MAEYLTDPWMRKSSPGTKALKEIREENTDGFVYRKI